MQKLICTAARLGNIDVLRQQEQSILGFRQYAATALIVAINAKQVDVVQWLLRVPGLHINAVFKKALMNAVIGSSLPIVDALLASSALFITEGAMYAVQFGVDPETYNVDIFRHLVEVPGMNLGHVLRFCARDNNVNAMQLLTSEFGVKCNYEHLWAAVKAGSLNAVQWLLAQPGVDVSFQHYFVLDIAQIYGRPKLLDLICPLAPFRICNDWNRHLRALVIRAAYTVTDHWKMRTAVPPGDDPLLHTLRCRRVLRAVPGKGVVEPFGQAVIAFL